MRIVVVEDIAMLREAIVKACIGYGHQVVAETADARETSELCREHRAEVLFLTMQQPDAAGLVKRLRRELAALKIVALAVHSTGYLIHRLARMSVDGFLDPKEHASAAIGEALAAIAAGRKWFSPSFHRIRRQQLRDPKFFGKLLTRREEEILGWIGRGLSNLEIGLRLRIAPRTVEDHRNNLMRKLQLDRATKLTAFAVVHGLVPEAAHRKIEMERELAPS